VKSLRNLACSTVSDDFMRQTCRPAAKRTLQFGNAFMNPIPAFRARLLQINTEVLHSPIPSLAEEMARTTQRLRAEYGDISRGAGDQQGIAAAVIDYLQNHQLQTYRDIKYVCFGISSPRYPFNPRYFASSQAQAWEFGFGSSSFLFREARASLSRFPIWRLGTSKNSYSTQSRKAVNTSKGTP
jgi:hypothetical protein